MGYAIYFDSRRNRDLGYGVPAVCDHPDCNVEIDRGLAYVCGDEPYGNEFGCALYFCSDHRTYKEFEDDECHQVCHACYHGLPEFPMKPDVEEWIRWKLDDESWKPWRDENPEEVLKMQAQISMK